jgi:hypothetical protein
VEGQLGQVVEAALGGDLGNSDRPHTWPDGRGLGDGVDLLHTHEGTGTVRWRVGTSERALAGATRRDFSVGRGWCVATERPYGIMST